MRIKTRGVGLKFFSISGEQAGKLEAAVAEFPCDVQFTDLPDKAPGALLLASETKQGVLFRPFRCRIIMDGFKFKRGVTAVSDNETTRAVKYNDVVYIFYNDPVDFCAYEPG